jgi:hypothetical protein
MQAALLWNQKKIRESISGYLGEEQEELGQPRPAVLLKSEDLHKNPGSPLPKNFPVEQVGFCIG